jgi:dTDP-4-amino-4,6-dideoxygalactose transaminase
MKIKLLDLVPQYEGIKKEIDIAISDVLSSQQFILGAQVAGFEEKFAEYCGIRHAVGVASGSDAILLALMALGIGPGDEVVTTSYTFFSTVSSITRLGAKPVFADIDPGTYNINPGGVASVLSDKTKAVVAVHLFGQTADMDPIVAAAAARGIPVIEDACQSVGALYKGKKAGSLGTAGCFSFFPSKNLGGFGDGGMIVTDHDVLAEKARLLRGHGAHERYFHDEIGINSRLDAIQAAVLQVKLQHLDEWNGRRRENAARYDKKLAKLEGITVPFVEKGNESIFNQYVIRSIRRDELKKHLTENDIGCEIYYPVPLHLQKCFAYLGGGEGDLPETEQAAKETLAIPVYPELSEKEIDYVASKIAEFMQ